MATGFDGSTAKIYGGGYDLTSFLKSMKTTGTRNTYDYTTLSALWKLFKYGRSAGEATAEGLHTTAPLQMSVIMAALHGTTAVFIQCPEGDTSASICACISGSVISRAINSPNSDIAMAVLNVVAKGGVDLATIIMPQTAAVAATTTYPAANGVDMGATTSNGGAAYLNVVTVGGTAAMWTLKVQSCATAGGAYADITGATWAAASVVSGYNNKVEIATSVTVLQYVQVVATKGASASTLTAMIAYARRSA